MSVTRLCASALLIGCGSASGSAVAPRTDGSALVLDAASSESESSLDGGLCDGTDRLRFRALVEAASDRELRGSMVRVELGSPFLVVDGACRYWIGAGWTEDALSRDRPLRMGKLGEPDARVLAQTIPLADLGALNDCKLMAGQSDISIRALRTERSSARCGSSGPSFDAAWNAVQSIVSGLWDKATTLDGTLHVSAVEAPNDDAGGPKAYLWPVGRPLATFVPDAGKDGSALFASGISKAVTDQDTIEKLRALRAQYLADRDAQPGIYANWDGLKVTDNAMSAWIYMRDAIPYYEDANGLLQF